MIMSKCEGREMTTLCDLTVRDFDRQYACTRKMVSALQVPENKRIENTASMPAAVTV
jgi:hypothetical protein